MDRPSSIVAHPGELANPGRLPHLDSLRGIAALLVVAHHAHFECSMASPLVRATSWMREGHFLVTFFIVLSGYCLSLPTLATGRLAQGFLEYLRRRAWRLLPAYYASLVGSLVLVATILGSPTGRHWDFALPVDGGSIVSHAFLVHNYDSDHLYKINHVFWSIAVEWQIYFAFPALLWLSRKVGHWWSTALALSLGMVGSYALIGSRHFGLTPHFYGMFALGMLAANLAHSPRWAYARDSVSWWTLAALAVLAAASMKESNTNDVLDLPVGVACVAVLVGFSKPGRVRGWLEWSPLVAIGGFSYSLYLVHAPLQHLLVEQGFERIGVTEAWEFPLLLVVGTPLIVAFAYGFHRAFERPFLRGAGRRGVPAPMGLRRIAGLLIRRSEDLPTVSDRSLPESKSARGDRSSS
jgi:peptidoglycan/LPS O-acetylase OafA/YrhL